MQTVPEIFDREIREAERAQESSVFIEWLAGLKAEVLASVAEGADG